MQIALLRGTNVGKAKRVAMAELCAIVAELGFGDVKTLLNSGNVIYSSPGTPPDEAGARIQEALLARTGVSSRVIVLTGEELVEAIDGNPLGEPTENPSRFLVAVLRAPEDRARLEPLLDEDWGTDGFALGRRVAYLWCRDGVLESRLPDALARAAGDAATTRNWATMLKLRALVDPPK
ncbi:MAG: DUF1697 domain-containing protein [Gemmatimonadetes bacterium]|nr:DUF1697 domain-containing protein [Gemmatimonadota bacterium]